MKILKIVILTAVFVFLGFLGIRTFYFAALKRPTQTEDAKELTIEKGAGVTEIADMLYDQGLINSKTLFKIYLKLNDLGSTLEAGEYEIPAGLNLKETVEILQHGTFDIKITFLEGWRREQIAVHASEVFNEEFPVSNSFVENFLSASEGMEGYLFPDTYFVEKGTTAKEIVQLMREMFDKKVTDDLVSRAEERGLSLDEVVILASIVEREVPAEEDRPRVAGILIKRWQNDWPLEADATVQYAIANSELTNCQTDELSNCTWWPKNLTKADLEIDSPYNTRKNKGLPPGPICNPGLSSLRAVVNYEQTPYWFYLSDKEGNTHYSKTLDGHNQNVVKYLRGW